MFHAPRPPAKTLPPVKKAGKERLHFWPYAAAVGLLAALGAGIVIGIDVGNDQVVQNARRNVYGSQGCPGI